MHFKGGGRQRQHKCNTRYQIAVAANDDDDNVLFVTIKTTLHYLRHQCAADANNILASGAKKSFSRVSHSIPAETA